MTDTALAGQPLTSGALIIFWAGGLDYLLKKEK
jgi:hypothetical protein